MSLSFSKLKTAHQCPYLYKKIYIEYIKEPSGAPALFGQAIHALFRDILVDNMLAKDAIKKWKFYFEMEIANNSEMIVMKNFDWWLKRGYPAIQLFYKQRASFDVQEVIKIEERLSGEYNGEVFSFVCDLVYKDSKGRTIILDYKTGKQKELDYYQLIFYKELLKLKSAELCLFYIWSGPIWIDINKFQENANQFVIDGIKIIRDGKFERRPSTKNCKYCSFKLKDCKDI